MIEKLKKPAALISLAATLASGCSGTLDDNLTSESNQNIIVDLRTNNPEISIDINTPVATIAGVESDSASLQALEQDTTTGAPDPFPSPGALITRVVLESQNTEIGRIIDNDKIVYGVESENPPPEYLGVMHSFDGLTATDINSSPNVVIIGGHSNAHIDFGINAGTYGVINAERYPKGNMPDDPGSQVGDKVILEAGGFACQYSVIDLRKVLDKPEFSNYARELDINKPYLETGVHPLLQSPGVYGGKPNYYEDYGLRKFLKATAEHLEVPMVAIAGSYSGPEDNAFLRVGFKANGDPKWQSAWEFAVGATLDGCVQIEAFTQ